MASYSEIHSSSLAGSLISYLRSNRRLRVLRCPDPPAGLPGASSSSGPWRRRAAGPPERSAASSVALWIFCSGTKPARQKQEGQRLLQSSSITVFFIFLFHQTSSVSCRRQIQTLITITTGFRPLLSAYKTPRWQNWKQINTYRLDLNPDRFEVIPLIYSISCSLLQSSRPSYNSHGSWNAEVSLMKSETFLEISSNYDFMQTMESIVCDWRGCPTPQGPETLSSGLIFIVSSSEWVKINRNTKISSINQQCGSSSSHMKLQLQLNVYSFLINGS